MPLMKRPQSRNQIAFAVAAFIAFAFLSGPALAQVPVPAVPGILNQQGRIAINNLNHEGPGFFKFALLKGDLSETLWTNDGTSTGAPGAEPAAAVETILVKGHYAVPLGDDTYHGNMTNAIPAAVFAENTDVRLCVWFATAAVGPFEKLSPNQRVTSVGYALAASTATMADMATTAATATMADTATTAATATSVSDDAITTVKILDGNITAAKLAPGVADDADADPTNEIQMLSLASSTLSLSNGGGSADLSGLIDLHATWLSGAGAPADSLGTNSDFYLDTTASAWYGPKAGNTWTATGPNDLVGPPGPMGADGPPGPMGVMGLTGADGAPGPMGVMGLTGADGAPGPMGVQGVQGVQGIQGIAGDPGVMGPAGPIGPSGPQGPDILAQGVGVEFPTLGAGTRLMWYTDNGAFRAGKVSGTQWDAANVGAQSTAFGRGTTASGDSSTAMGYDTTASGTASTAMGQSTEASGNRSTAMGETTIASGTASTAMGQSTEASGNRSTAMGETTIASGNRSTAMGSQTTANGSYSTAFGRGTTASGSYSTAMGSQTTASGHYSTAMGRDTEARGLHSTAFGQDTEAISYSSTAMGYQTTARGNYSTAMGFRTTAPSASEVVLGQYNTAYTLASTTLWDSADRLFVLGNGTADANRSDALIVYKNGNATLAGTLTQLSDRNKKENFVEVDPASILDKVAALPVSTWNYKTSPGTDRHIGPMAQDFHAAFGLGNTDKGIATVDADGIALAAIQGLNQKVESENETLKRENEELRRRLEKLENLVGKLAR